VAEDSTSWNGFNLFETSTNFDQSLLMEGNNSIKVELVDLPGAPDLGDAAYVDWVDVTYYDSLTAEGDLLPFSVEAAGSWEFTVTGVLDERHRGLRRDLLDRSGLDHGDHHRSYEPLFDPLCRRGLSVEPLPGADEIPAQGPQRIEQVVYPSSPYTPPSLTALGFGADYILITHPDFWAEAWTLATHRYRTFDRVGSCERAAGIRSVSTAVTCRRRPSTISWSMPISTGSHPPGVCPSPWGWQ